MIFEEALAKMREGNVVRKPSWKPGVGCVLESKGFYYVYSSFGGGYTKENACTIGLGEILADDWSVCWSPPPGTTSVRVPDVCPGCGRPLG